MNKYTIVIAIPGDSRPLPPPKKFFDPSSS